jgi:FkbM family methyltransferase
MTLPLNKRTFAIAKGLRRLTIASRLRGCDRLIRLFFNPDLGSGCHFQLNLGALEYQGVADSFIDWNILFYGAYEESDLLVLQAVSELQKTRIFLDIGANVGQHSLYLSQFCKKVLAFEPNTEILPRFEKNISLNDIQNIRIFPLALGDADKSAVLYKSNESGDNSLLNSYGRVDARRSMDVQVRSGDKLLSDNEVQEGIDLVKIDVEGVERTVLEGLRKTLQANRPIMLMEMSYAGQQQFGNADVFAGSFPDNYVFYAWDAYKGVRRRSQLAQLSASTVFLRSGNIYAVPAEKLKLFEQALKTRRSRLMPLDPANIRIL